MIVFIISCLLIATLVLSGSEWVSWLETPAALGIGLFGMAASLLAGYLQKVRTMAWHDGFATAGLLIWFAYWRPQFNPETPMFYVFPLYYAFLTTLVTLGLINRIENFDVDSVLYMRHLEKITRFDMSAIIVFVMIGLLITRHYALYPMAMTFFIMRHTMLICLEAYKR
jgi:hypothetical protein